MGGSPFTRVPNELLVSIFKLSLHHDEFSGKKIDRGENRLAHICRHSRATVLSAPAFWRHVSNDQKPDELDAYLRRSGHSGLNVVLDLDENAIDSYSHFMEVVTTHSHRWESFEFIAWKININSVDTLETFGTLSNICHRLFLPRLKSMFLIYPDSPVDDERELGHWNGVFNKSNEYHFYKNWSMPCLRRLRTDSLIPAHMEGVTLETLELHINFRCAVLPEAMLRVPSSPMPPLQSLRHLSLIVDIGLPSPLLGGGGGRISLPLLETLTFSDVNVTSYNPVNSLYMPNLSEMTLQLPISYAYGLDEGLSQILHSDNDFRFLRMLYLGNPRFHYVVPPPVLRLDQVFRRFPHLQVLGVSRYLCTIDTVPSTVPPLLTIALQGSSVDADVVRLLVETLKAGKAWSQFEKFRFTRCQSITLPELKVILPEDKFKWT